MIDDKRLDVKLVPVALQRIIDEVSSPDFNPNAYNRTYTRHNRSLPMDLPPSKPKPTKEPT